MRPTPARTGMLYSPSGTHTAEPYDFARYQTHYPNQNPDAAKNQLARFLTSRSQQRLNTLRSMDVDWDGYGSAKPNPDAIANAEARLPELYRLSTIEGVWREPHISSSEEGDITFEWWSGPRKITMYFAPTSMELYRVWGPNIDTEMAHVDLQSLDAFPEVWAWLYGK